MIFTKRDEKKIKGNSRHFPIISSETMKLLESHKLSLFGTWKKLSFTEKASKKSSVKQEDEIT